MATRTIDMKLDVDTKKGTAAIKKVKGSVKDLGSTAKTTAKSMSSISFTKIATGAAVFYGLTKAISFANRAMKDFIKLAGIQEAAESNLAAVLKATGNAAGYSTSELHSMAAAMQSVTTVGDEVIINAMAILATFKKVKGEAFKDTMDVALDMSRVLKKDLNSSITMIGKAMNDPIRGMTALSLAGVQFTEEQRDMVKALIDSNDFIGAQAIVLKELESQFKGAATAARDTFGGAMIATGNAFGDLKEQLGFVITKNLFFMVLLTKMEDKFIAWGKYIEDNRLALGKLAKEGLITVITHLRSTIKVIHFFSDTWKTLVTMFELGILVMVGGLKVLYEALRLVLVPIDLVCRGLKAIGMIDENPFDKISTALTDFTVDSLNRLKIIQDEWDKSQKGYALIEDAIDNIIVALNAIPTGITVLDPITVTATKDATDQLTVSVNQLIQAYNDMFDGLSRGFQQSKAETQSWGKLCEDIGKQSANRLADAMTDSLWDVVDGTKSAKEAFRDFGKSIMSWLFKIIVRWAILKALQSSTSLFGGFTAGSAAGGTGGGAASSGNMTAFTAKGGVFDQSGMAAYANGGVVSTPTNFAFANGGIGLMGEAGSEAIMPLSRTSGGELGVKTDGQSEQPTQNIIINAVDTKSFADALQRNPAGIISIVNEALQDRGPILDTIRQTL